MIAVALHISRQVDVGELEVLAAPRHPGEAALVVDEVESVVAPRRVDVVGPHPSRLVQMLIAVDDPRHAWKSPPVRW